MSLLVIIFVGSVHEVVKFITAVEVAATFTWAVRSTDALSLFLIISTNFVFIRFFAAIVFSVATSNVLSSTVVSDVGVVVFVTAVSIDPFVSVEVSVFTASFLISNTLIVTPVILTACFGVISVASSVSFSISVSSVTFAGRVTIFTAVTDGSAFVVDFTPCFIWLFATVLRTFLGVWAVWFVRIWAAVSTFFDEGQFSINVAAFLSFWGTAFLLALLSVLTPVVTIVFIATVFRALHGIFAPFFRAVAAVVASSVAFTFIAVLSVSSLVPIVRGIIV